MDSLTEHTSLSRDGPGGDYAPTGGFLDTFCRHSHNENSLADVAELADAQVSEACDGDIVEVQVLSSAPKFGSQTSEPFVRLALFPRGQPPNPKSKLKSLPQKLAEWCLSNRSAEERLFSKGKWKWVSNERLRRM
jgi:hypothetical protein